MAASGSRATTKCGPVYPLARNRPSPATNRSQATEVPSLALKETGNTGSVPLSPRNSLASTCVLLAVLALVPNCKKVVPVPERWDRTFGGADDDEGAAVARCSDGGYVVVGTTSSFGAGKSDIYLIKADAKGNLVWTQTFGDTGYDCGQSVQTTTDGGCIIAGYIGDSVCLIKTDAEGNQVWTKTFGDAAMDGGLSVLQTRDRGYGVLYEVHCGDVEYACLAKTDESGDLSWSEFLNIIGESVLQTSDDGYVVVGEVNEPYSACYDVGLVRVDASGHAVWANAYRRLESEDYGYSVQPTADGGYIIAAEAESQVYIIRTDADGNEVWTRTLYGECEASGRSIERTDDDGYIVAGWSEDGVLLLRLDADGDSLWAVTYGGAGSAVDDSRYSVRQTSDGGFVIAGTTDDLGFGDEDVWLIKTDSDGKVWVLH